MLLRLLLILVVLMPIPVVAADFSQLGKEGAPIRLEADQLSYDRETGLYRASGDVTLIQGDFEVYSQELQWNQTSGDLEAEGDVRLVSPDEVLSGRKVHYNLLQGTGVIENGHFFLPQQNLHVYGEKIERLGVSDYRIYDGTFTTCDGDVPSWKFGASQVDLTLGGYARARNTVFYLKNIPSAYFPYMIYPAKTDRESGLLIPGVGYSDSRGFQYSAAYYQVLGVNQDATLYLDYLSKMGLGKGLEYRYIFGGGNAGEAKAYHINVDQVDGVKVNEQRYALKWRHDGMLPGAVRLVADTAYVNDKDYFKDFGGAAGEYNKDQVQSKLFLTRHWDRYSLVGLFKYTKDLQTDDKTTLQLLPRVTFDTTRQRFGESVFFYDFTTEYSHFWREEGLRGERLMARPALSAHIPLAKVFDLAPELAWRQRYYWGLSDDSSATDAGLVEFSTKLATTALERGYTAFGTTLRHALFPEVTYSNIPDVDQSDLPEFDDFDRIDAENNLEYALVQRLTGSFSTSEQGSYVRELIYLRVGLVQDLRQEADGSGFTDLRTELKLQPTEYFSFASDSTYATDAGQWQKFSAHATLADSQENSVSARYRYNREDDVDYAAINLSTSFLKPVYLTYQQRYDFTEDQQLEQIVAVEYRQQCWSVRLALRDRENDRSVMLSFSMSGIGSVGSDATTPGGI